MSARQQLTTVGEVVLDGLLSGVAAVVAVVLSEAARVLAGLDERQTVTRCTATECGDRRHECHLPIT